MPSSKVLTKEYIQENSSEEAAVEYMKEYLFNARLAFGITNLLSYLGNEAGVLSRPLTQDEAQNACGIVLHCLKMTPHDQILAYIKSCEEDENARKVFEPTVSGSA